MNVNINASRRNHKPFRGHDFCGTPDNQARCNIHSIRVSRLSDTNNLSVFNPDVSFDDAQHRIDNDGICHTDIQHPVFRGFAGHISHSIPVGFSAAEQDFVSVTIRRVIFFYLRNQAGIRKVDLVTDGRSEHFTIFLSG